MRKLRAYTIAETLIAVGLMAGIVASVSALFSFTVKRSLGNAAKISVLQTGRFAASEIAKTIESAVTCDKVGSGNLSALVCTMPQSGIDTDADGQPDSFTPIRIGKRGVPRYGSGKRVWYYLSSSSGQYGTGGSYLFRAVCATTGNPTPADIDFVWSMNYSTDKPKRGPFASFTVSKDATAKTITFALTSSVALFAERAPQAGERQEAQSISRTVSWSNLP